MCLLANITMYSYQLKNRELEVDSQTTSEHHGAVTKPALLPDWHEYCYYTLLTRHSRHVIIRFKVVCSTITSIEKR